VSTWLPYLFFFLLFGGMIYFVSRQARGQMSGIMSIGRSKARQYSASGRRRPLTTSPATAGEAGDLRSRRLLEDPARFKEIGPRSPRACSWSAPGDGQDLLARAVAGEAGVPFLSVSGRTSWRCSWASARAGARPLPDRRKQAPAIIFVDEIDSIGRKRGLPRGGHDEREQTLNQMLNEMDGFDPAEGVVIIAATNRPDILDPALLRPGRFDRQIVVPSRTGRAPADPPVHCRGKRIGPDVDLALVARGTPGMSGADLANLVNEAHCTPCAGVGHHRDGRLRVFRDRVLMGQRRESLVLSPTRRSASPTTRAPRRAGLRARARRPRAQGDHPATGMALGVTQQLPIEERHIHPRIYIEDSLCVRMAAVAELLVYGDLSTGRPTTSSATRAGPQDGP